MRSSKRSRGNKKGSTGRPTFALFQDGSGGKADGGKAGGFKKLHGRRGKGQSQRVESNAEVVGAARDMVSGTDGAGRRLDSGEATGDATGAWEQAGGTRRNGKQPRMGAIGGRRLKSLLASKHTSAMEDTYAMRKGRREPGRRDRQQKEGTRNVVGVALTTLREMAKRPNVRLFPTFCIVHHPFPPLQRTACPPGHTLRHTIPRTAHHTTPTATHHTSF